MSAEEQEYLRDTLSWLSADVDSQWRAGHWCLTLETRSLTLSVLISKTSEPVRVALEAR